LKNRGRNLPSRDRREVIEIEAIVDRTLEYMGIGKKKELQEIC